jgi:hemolysin activation/secretion protein
MSGLNHGGASPQEAALIQDLLRGDPSLSQIPPEALLDALRYERQMRRRMPQQQQQQQQAPRQSSLAAPPQVSAQPLSRQLLRVIKELNRAVAIAQVPVSLGAQVFIEDPAKRDELLAIMDIIHRMTGAPIAADTFGTAISNVHAAPPDARAAAMRQAAGQVGEELLIQSIPTLRSLSKHF